MLAKLSVGRFDMSRRRYASVLSRTLRKLEFMMKKRWAPDPMMVTLRAADSCEPLVIRPSDRPIRRSRSLVPRQEVMPKKPKGGCAFLPSHAGQAATSAVPEVPDNPRY